MRLRRRLFALIEAEDRLIAELGPGHSRVERLRNENIRELELIIDDDGWPTLQDAGEEGAEAALRIALGAVNRPSFMRLCLTQLLGAVRRGEALPAHAERLAARLKAVE
ncbi:MAG: hypothetical protein HYU60_07260 [Magnetospirillum sp.]|nr:hypothetical protein [Magnetospirillum sp.]